MLDVLTVSMLIAGGFQPIAACPERSAPRLEVSLERGAVSVSYGLSLDEIRRLSEASDTRAVHPPFGLYASTFHYTIDVDDAAVAPCLGDVRARVKLVLGSRQIVLGRELADHACLRDAALAHYERHARANLQAFLALSQRLQAVMTDPQLASALQAASSGPSAVAAILRPIIDEQLPQFDADNLELRGLVDTPTEVRQLEDACRTPI